MLLKSLMFTLLIHEKIKKKRNLIHGRIKKKLRKLNYSTEWNFLA